jgi:hypothetical protein
MSFLYDVIYTIKNDVKYGNIDNTYFLLMSADWFDDFVSYLGDIGNEEREDEAYRNGYSEGQDYGYQQGWDDAKYEAEQELTKSVEEAFENGYAAAMEEMKEKVE